MFRKIKRPAGTKSSTGANSGSLEDNNNLKKDTETEGIQDGDAKPQSKNPDSSETDNKDDDKINQSGSSRPHDDKETTNAEICKDSAGQGSRAVIRRRAPEQQNSRRAKRTRLSESDDDDEENAEREDYGATVVTPAHGSTRRQRRGISTNALDDESTRLQRKEETLARIRSIYGTDEGIRATEADVEQEHRLNDQMRSSAKDKDKPKSRRIGPQQASSFLRGKIIIDYQPDVCKDYKETGFCGYGDSCKFLHDRGDYKMGWQLDREWEKSQRERQNEAIQRQNKSSLQENSDQAHSESKPENTVLDDCEGLPFSCHLCRGEFKAPVVTKCEHYFCQVCIMAHFKKKPRCPVCAEPLRGLFKPARNLLRLIAERNERIKEKEEHVRAANCALNQEGQNKNE